MFHASGVSGLAATILRYTRSAASKSPRRHSARAFSSAPLTSSINMRRAVRSRSPGAFAARRDRGHFVLELGRSESRESLLIGESGFVVDDLLGIQQPAL